MKSLTPSPTPRTEQHRVLLVGGSAVFVRVRRACPMSCRAPPTSCSALALATPPLVVFENDCDAQPRPLPQSPTFPDQPGQRRWAFKTGSDVYSNPADNLID